MTSPRDPGKAEPLPHSVGKNRCCRIREHGRSGVAQASENSARLVLRLSGRLELVELLLRGGQDQERVDLMQVVEGELTNHGVDDVDLRASSLGTSFC